MAKVKARGLRNNNPGNIDYNAANKWQGQVGIEETPPSIKPRFAKFESPVYGIRAIAVLLIAYYDRHGCDTVRKVINRWAPPSENATNAYVAAVAAKCKVGPDEVVTLHDQAILKPIVCSIIEHENGLKSYRDEYGDDIIDKALVMAGVVPPQKPITKTATVTGASVATAGVTLSALADVAQETSTQIQPLIDYSDTLRIVFVLITLLGIGLTVYGRIRQRQKGIA